MIPFSPPRIDQRIIDEVADTLRSGWITTGMKTRKFEQRLTEYCGNHATVCVGSATQGLELILKWFGVGEGDEVIVPAYTYCATANVVVHCGAKPVMVDVQPDFNISIDAIKAAMTERTKAIIPVDIAGFPCDYNEINDLVEGANVRDAFNPTSEEQEKLGRPLVLADAAHSIGARYCGNMSGNLCDISVFSFHAVKNLTTAEGGAVCLNLPEAFDCDELYKQLCISSLHGQSKDALSKIQKGGWRYDVVEAGYKCNMTDIQAAMGLVELERYEDDMLKVRKGIFDQYNVGLKDCEWAILPPVEEADKVSSCHVYLLRVKDIDEEQRDRIIDGIFKREVSVNVHFLPLPLLSFYKGMGYNMDDFPNAFDNYKKEISLPVYYDLSNENVRTVIEAVKSSVEEVVNG